jgi:hypothetical protein
VGQGESVRYNFDVRPEMAEFPSEKRGRGNNPLRPLKKRFHPSSVPLSERRQIATVKPENYWRGGGTS